MIDDQELDEFGDVIVNTRQKRVRINAYQKVDDFNMSFVQLAQLLGVKRSEHLVRRALRNFCKELKRRNISVADLLNH